jgi:hypothetical protein
VGQILICTKLLGTHPRLCSPVSGLYNHPDGVGLAPFSRACCLVSAPPTLLGCGSRHCHGINYTQNAQKLRTGLSRGLAVMSRQSCGAATVATLKTSPRQKQPNATGVSELISYRWRLLLCELEVRECLTKGSSSALSLSGGSNDFSGNCYEQFVNNIIGSSWLSASSGITLSSA